MQAMNRSMCSGRVAAGPRALPTGARSACSAATQRTTVRVCMSLRSVEAIAELIGAVRPEEVPVLKKLLLAVKEDLEEAQQQVEQQRQQAEQQRQQVEQQRQQAEQQRQQAEQQRQQAEQRKDEAVAAMMVLADKVRQQEKVVTKAMSSAGVRDGRSCLEYLEKTNGISKQRRKQGWTEVLEQRPQLIACLSKAAPSWGVDVNDPKAAGTLAKKIIGMFSVLNDQIHTFVPEVGLVVYTGIPDSPTSEALVCLAEAFGVPCERHKSVSP